jgi:hypothetical protein
VSQAAGVCFDCNYVHWLHSVNKFLASALRFQVRERARADRIGGFRNARRGEKKLEINQDTLDTL